MCLSAAEAVIAETYQPVAHLLEISLHHLPFNLGNTGLRDVPGLAATELPDGWLITVPETVTSPADQIPALAGLLDYARALGCSRMLLDRTLDPIDWTVTLVSGEELEPPALWWWPTAEE